MAQNQNQASLQDNKQMHREPVDNVMDQIKQEFWGNGVKLENQVELIADLRKDVSKNIIQIEGLIEKVKQNIMEANYKDRQQIGEDMPAIFEEGVDSYLKLLDFNGVSLIKMLENNEKLV